MSHARPSRVRVASAHVLGRPLKHPARNSDRARLLDQIARSLADRLGPDRLDALILPAGFFRLDLALGPMAPADRAKALHGSELDRWCRRAAALLSARCGALLIIGVDTAPFGGGSGDQFMAAWGPNGVVGSARKVFPSHGDTRPGKKRPYLLFSADADDSSRIVQLGGGAKALLCVCYDAFLFSEFARGPTSSRAAMRFIGDRTRRPFEPGERDALIERFAALVARERPEAALIAVHGFEQPGGEVRWQRHGIASASAGLGGGLAVGAAHYRYWLPDHDDLIHATLASSGVGPRHLTDGLHRKSRKLPATDSFLVKVPGAPRLRAVVRVFEA